MIGNSNSSRNISRNISFIKNKNGHAVFFLIEDYNGKNFVRSELVEARNSSLEILLGFVPDEDPDDIYIKR